MGQEITSSRFRKQDFSAFQSRLAQETALLGEWFAAGRFSEQPLTAGFELEAWLVGPDGRPAPLNEEFLAALASDLASPELARFNVEVNGTPQRLHGDVLARMHRELAQTWRRCRRTAAALDARIAMIGILPTVRDEMLSLESMSRMERYRALNEQVLRIRKGRPLPLDIKGRETLHTEHRDVMLESVATSFQLHLQVNQREAVRYFNAAVILSAPMVAACANSPYLFGADLWDETRIPVFEQAVAVGGFEGAAFGPIKRVTFGQGYLLESLFECFEENLQHYPVLLPVHLSDRPEVLAHLRLHNGTIWRWNRPLIGFDADGTPHLRIEHRVIPAGPTVEDAIANAAFFYGLVHALGSQEVAPELELPFDKAKDNFYNAARQGLGAPVTWLRGRRCVMADLLLNDLLPLARSGLERLGLASTDVDRYLGIMAGRLHTGQTGAAWQRAYVAAHGRDMAKLTSRYLACQDSGRPVHEWPL